ncbi:hypothetical protein P3T76_008302 [Phytophthora citrophthora]|uniref:Uncharacterized protein n=1 Tax=Phytophthora citrophthora TaxID=4793 RepID=A0AAD9GKD7_9STRA|nr:hypothetical protein P3T76_008294 [Phytophthora citrophthora]KAK1939979.1 hypothetical protein P3T76_008302 [Phytophthora citrophthora]
MLRPKLSFKQASLAHAVTVDKSNQSTISAEQSTISAEQSAIEISSDVPLFEDFWRHGQDGMGLLGADDDNYVRLDLVTEQDIKQFIDDRHVLYNQDLRAGATWVDVRDFMIRLREAGRGIDYNAFVKNNYMTPGRRGARVRREVPLEVGAYIVAAYNHSHIGHAVVLLSKGENLSSTTRRTNKVSRSCPQKDRPTSMHLFVHSLSLSR